LVEHSLGKGEVISSILIIGSRVSWKLSWFVGRFVEERPEGFVEGRDFSRAVGVRIGERLQPLRFRADG
jgi:hypothetical protein